MAFSAGASQRIFVKKQSAFGAIPTLAAANGCAAISFDGNNQQDVEIPQDRNGTLAPVKGNLGPLGMSWTAEITLRANGAAGVAPDMAPFLEAAFGEQVVSAGTDVLWRPHDTNEPYITVCDQAANANVEQRLAFDLIVSQLVLEMSADFPRARFSGGGRCVISQKIFASLPTNMKGGLGAWPTLPSTIVTNGVPPQNRQGVITLDSNDMGANFESATITFDTGRGMDGPGWGVGGTAVSRGSTRTRRSISFSITLTEDDSAALDNLLTKALLGTYIPITLQLGTVAGSRWLVSMPQALLAAPQRGYGGLNLSRTITGRAYPLSGQDEITIKAY